MDMTIGSNLPSAQVGAAEPVATAPGVKSAAVASMANLKVTVANGTPLEDLPLSPEVYKAISNMIAQHFDALMTIAKNMGVSKEEREAAMRRLKDLKEKRRRAEDLERDELKQIIQLIGMLKTETDDWLNERWAEGLKG